MERNDYELYVSICERIASDLHTMVQVRDYPQYGWASIAFMTDPFGGTYTHLHYDHATGEVINWYGSDNAQKIEDEAHLRKIVTQGLKYELAHRNLDEVYEAVNDEY